MSKRRILIIPHQPHRQVRVRALEMASFLAKQPQWEIYVLTWQHGPANTPNFFEKLKRKAEDSFKSLQTPLREEVCDNIHWVTLPYLLAPNPLCQAINAAQIARVMKRFEIDAVINGNAYHFPVPEMALRRGPRKPPLYIYDIVDDHLSENSGPAWQVTRRFTLDECQKANHILSISHAMNDLLQAQGFPTPLYIPNGVDFWLYTKKDTTTIQQLKDRFGINKHFTIAYIGNHGWWAGIPFLVDVFKKLQKQVNAKLLIVGPGENIPELSAKYACDDIHFTGAVPPTEVANYFNLTDVGILPCDLTPFKHNAMPLKVLEYGAAKKQVIASPLKELQTLNYPHVDLLPLEIEPWVNALVKIAGKPPVWNADWDNVMAQYDWSLVFAPLQDLLVQELLVLGPLERQPA